MASLLVLSRSTGSARLTYGSHEAGFTLAVCQSRASRERRRALGAGLTSSRSSCAPGAFLARGATLAEEIKAFVLRLISRFADLAAAFVERDAVMFA
jgi:hypothetical protein